MTTGGYICHFGQPLLKQARHVPSSYTVVVQKHVRGITNVAKQVLDAHRCASGRVDALTVVKQWMFSHAR